MVARPRAVVNIDRRAATLKPASGYPDGVVPSSAASTPLFPEMLGMVKRTLTAALAAALVVLIVGCVPSLHGLYKSADDLVFNEQLLGAWSPPKESKETWTFSRLGEGDEADPKAYLLTIIDGDGKQALLQARLVKVKDKLFLDLYPHEMELNAGAWYRIHLVPAHTFMAVRGIGATLDVAIMDRDKLDNLLKDDPKLIAHERPQTDGLVLTAGPEALQTLFTEKYDTLFGETQAFTRRAAQEATTKPAAGK
jgi:hypothetical protein